jgi:fermentation-respiration switch protein FrsA (DUF1100 family)
VKSKQRIVQSVDREQSGAHGRELQLTFRVGRGNPVPAILQVPHGTGPFPAALLVHGYSSRKEEMSGPMGHALLARGLASLAIDLPLHGTRGDPVQAQSARNPIQVLQLWRESLADVRLGLGYLGARPEVNAGRLAMIGYSLGSFLSVEVAADHPNVRALVVAAGGDLPEGTPFTAIARLTADPLRAIQKLRGRPLLMVHGRRDRTVRPEQAERLFAAAAEPKELRWFDSGHYLPPRASAEVADWLAERLGADASRDAG